MFMDKHISLRIRQEEYRAIEQIIRKHKKLYSPSHFIRAAIIHYIQYYQEKRHIILRRYLPCELEEYGRKGSKD